MRDVPIADPPVEDLGPRMLALTPQQRRFVIGWIGTRGKSGARAAKAAGYSDEGEACKVRAHGLLRNEKVLAALKEEADRRLDSIAIMAVLGLEDLLGSKNPKVRQIAIDSALDRTGYGRKTTQDIRVEHVDKRSTAEILAEVRRLMPPSALPVIEGEVLETADAEGE